MAQVSSCVSFVLLFLALAFVGKNLCWTHKWRALRTCKSSWLLCIVHTADGEGSVRIGGELPRAGIAWLVEKALSLYMNAQRSVRTVALRQNVAIFASWTANSAARNAYVYRLALPATRKSAPATITG
ncbi:hypothetical protein EJB05_23092, partial [Eragrostis curvula]